MDQREIRYAITKEEPHLAHPRKEITSNPRQTGRMEYVCALHGLDVAIEHLHFSYIKRELKSSRQRQAYQYALYDLKKLREGMTQQNDNTRDDTKVSLDKAR